MGFGYKIRNSRYCFSPDSKDPFRISRSKIDLFMNCPRCFYLDQRHGVARTGMPPFSLNNAVDELMKREFDYYRNLQEPHPLMVEHNIDAVPFQHEKLEEWRDALRNGVQYHDTKKNLIIRGGIDDVWVNKDEELIVADYKATSKEGEVNLDADWQIAYKRQVEVYQWLFRKNDFKVSNTAYFVYVNGDLNAENFNNTLSFKATIIPHEGDDSWIDPVIEKIHACLHDERVPKEAADCEYCAYRAAAGKVLQAKHLAALEKQGATKKQDTLTL